MTNVAEPVPAAPSTGLSLLTLDDIVKIHDHSFKIIDVPEWGCQVRIGSLTALDVADWMEAIEDKRKARIAGIRLLVLAIEGPNGEKVERLKLDGYIGLMANKSAVVVNRLITEVRLFNGLDKKEEEKRKNDSGEVDSSDSSSASPSS